jgi:cholesterol transport system auxiliary component
MCSMRVSGLRAPLIAALALAVAACGGLLGKERTPHSIYVLSLDAGGQAAPPGGCGILEVSPPAPAPGFATARMVYQREAHRLEPFAYSRWAEPPAPMVQQALLEALARSGLFGAVLAAPAAVAPDLRLESDALRVVQWFEDGTSRAEISLNVRLVDLRAARLLAVRDLSASAPAGAGPASGVAAANEALSRLAAELVELAGRSLDCGELGPEARAGAARSFT